jgi:uncharacterized repeat protein (TIGR01451 family)
MKRAFVAALMLGSTLAGMSASALTAEQVVEREIVIINVDGTETITREKADQVVPGERIVYSINYFNDLDETAENIVMVMPIPVELVFVEGSAEASGVPATYSVDGGQTFADRQDLTVVLEDESNRAAISEDITHVKWVVATVDPGKRGSLSFTGILK